MLFGTVKFSFVSLLSIILLFVCAIINIVGYFTCKSTHSRIKKRIISISGIIFVICLFSQIFIISDLGSQSTDNVMTAITDNYDDVHFFDNMDGGLLLMMLVPPNFTSNEKTYKCHVENNTLIIINDENEVNYIDGRDY